MKVSYALALAATVEQAYATGALSAAILKKWMNVDPYPCPGKTPIICVPPQVPGHDYQDCPEGPVGNYGGCNYDNWTCKKKYGRRDMLAGRKDDGSKIIEGECGADGDSGNPVISAGKDIGTFEIKSFSVQSEYDARLEFHYSMGDGSTCKQSCAVSTEGTSVANTQCGGAKSVKIVLPPNKKTKTGLSKCKIKCSGIKFDCPSNPPKTTTPPPKTTVSTVRPSTSKQTTPPAQSTSIKTPPAVSTSIKTPPAVSTSINTPPAVSTSIKTPPAVSTSINTPPAVSTSINTPPAVTTSINTPPAVTTSINTPPAVTTSINTPPAVTTSINTPPAVSTSTNTPPATPPGTSTSFITTIKTITSCGPEIKSCPIKTPGETGTVTISSIVSITTQTQSSEQPQETGTKTSPPVPSESLPCPESVPRCLMSWLDLVKECKNNADAECFCKNSNYTNNVFQCLYSYGGSDKDIADSISFFQGICGRYAGENPNIVIGPSTITQIITATPAPLPSASVTTIIVDTTITELCVSSGTTITGSSTTRVINTQVSVPVVTLSPPAAVPTGGGAPTTVAPTTVAPGVPVGTGVPTAPSGNKPPVVVGGAGKVQAGILGAVVMALVAAL